jgi:N-acetylneuraminic acid mutarotase
MSGEKQTGAYRNRAGAIACGALLLAALVGAVPLAGQITPSSAGKAGDWTWMSGSDTLGSSNQGVPGVYGTLGTPNGTVNFPGGRWGAPNWIDSNGNLWLFGGYGFAGNATATFGYLNDLWEFNPSNNEWTWMGGVTTLGGDSCAESPTYGTLGSFAPGNLPGGRQSAASWTEKKGFLGFCGAGGAVSGPPAGACGGAYNFGRLNDLWKFSPSIYNTVTRTYGEWAWMSGSNTTPSFSGPPGSYGTIGVYGPSNFPGGRQNASTWTDSSGNLWLFGGDGYDGTQPNPNFGELNDLWEFNPNLPNSATGTNGEWAWMGGSSTVPQYSGNPGVFVEPGQYPGSRSGAASWTDSSGNFWLFGGEGFDGAGNGGNLNDLWEFNPSTSIWAWISGSAVISNGGQPGMYGTMGTPNGTTNVPGGRYEAASWIDSSGNLWLSGGQGNGATSAGMLNDLWAFNPPTDQWVWMGGSGTPFLSGVYGTLQSAANTSIPGGRNQATSWTDIDGNLWLFGGDGRAAGSAVGALNDLWVYPPPAICWGPPSAIQISPATLLAGFPGESYFQNFTGTGGCEAGYVWSITSGAAALTNLGLSFSPAGDLSGYPNAPGSYPFTVQVTDPLGDSKSQNYTLTIYPDITVLPTSLPAGTMGTPYSQQLTGGGGAGGPFSFSVISGTALSAVSLTLSTGGLISGTPNATETAAPLTIKIADSLGYYTEANYTLTVNAATSTPAQVMDNETITVTDTETFPDVVDSEAITVTDIDSVRAYNAIAITPNAASFNASSGNGYATYAYSAQFAATGGIGALALTETGTLPAGITFVNGLLSGTPVASSVGNTYTFSVTATDADGDSITVPGYSLTILAASAYPAVVTDNETITVTDTETFSDVVDSEPITVTDKVLVTVSSPLAITGPASLPGGYLNEPYPNNASTTITASGGTQPYTWTVTGLPAGLGINASTGVISGKPTADAGSPYSVTVTVEDNNGIKASKTYSLTVGAALTITSPSSLPTLYVDSTSNLPITFNASGGSGGYSWTVAGQPSGLTMSTVSGAGELSGTPAANTVGAYSVTVTVTDSASNTNSVIYSLTVASPSLGISASPPTLTIVQGQSGHTTITFTPVGGYPGPVTLSCTGLPANTLCSFTLLPSGTPITSPLTFNGQQVMVLLTIQTDVGAMATVQPESAPTPLRPGAILAAIAFSCPGSLLGLIALRRKRKLFTKNPRNFGLCLFVLLVGAMAGLAGCISSGGFGTYVTPVGSSTVTVVVTPSSGSAQTLNIGLTITQQ